MKLGTHHPTLVKSREIINKYLNTIQQIEMEMNENKKLRLYGQLHYTSYAVACQVVVNDISS